MTKKITVFFIGCLLVTTLFSGCSKKAVKDETNCFVSFDQAKAASKKSKKPILAIFTQEEGEQNGGSKYFVDNILLNKEFSKYCDKKYVLYRMDFSMKNFQKTAINDEATEDQQKAAREYADYLQQGVQLAQYVGFSYSPAFFVFTKEGYLVAEVEYTEDSMNVQAFSALLDDYLKQVDYVENLISATNKGTQEEKLNAIDALYSVTPAGGRYFLTPFAQKAFDMDPENKTGRIGVYYFILADEKASKLYLEQDSAGSIQTYIAAAESGMLDSEYVQQCYYMAAWVLESISAMDTNLILDYLEKAYKAAPDSVYAEEILGGIEYYQTQFSSTAAGESE